MRVIQSFVAFVEILTSLDKLITYLLALSMLAFCSISNGQIAEFRTDVRCNDPGQCRQQRRVGTAVNVGRLNDREWIFVSSGHQISGGELISAEMALGAWVPARYLGDRFNEGVDLSVWAVAHADPGKSYPIASQVPGANAEVKHVGLDTQWRDVRTKIIGMSGGNLLTRYPAVSGHSGGPILANGCVVGIIWGTTGSQTYSVPAPVVCETVRRFCPRYQCGCGKPAPAPNVEPPTPAPPQTVELDYDKLAAAVFALIQKDAERFRGPVGPAGPQGPRGPAGVNGEDGVDGTNGKDAAPVDLSAIDAIREEIPRSIKVRLIITDEAGNVTIRDQEYPLVGPDSGIVLKFDQRVLKGE